MNADVIIIGGGPAGSTAATLLTQLGRSVIVVEKERFPRFHIGESLLPIDLPIFERLGFAPTAERFVYKTGAEFLDEKTDDFALYRFCDGLKGTPRYAWQVDRHVFDGDLLKLSETTGAKVMYERRVEDVKLFPDHVVANLGDEKLTARYLVDASGQNAFLGRKNRTIKPLRGLGVAACFSHFHGVDEACDAELKEMGNIKIFMRPDGWVWMIPLVGHRVSIGCVSKKKGVHDGSVQEVLDESPLLQYITRGTERTPPTRIGNYSFINERAYGSRFICIGDASAFLDPVFSSGVSLGMISAELMADRLNHALAENREAEPDLMKPVSQKMYLAYVCFGTLIKSFYHTNLVRHFFFHPNPEPEARAGLISMLAGDVFRDDNEFQNGLINGRRRWTPADDAPID